MQFISTCKSPRKCHLKIVCACPPSPKMIVHSPILTHSTNTLFFITPCTTSYIQCPLYAAYPNEATLWKSKVSALCAGNCGTGCGAPWTFGSAVIQGTCEASKSGVGLHALAIILALAIGGSGRLAWPDVADALASSISSHNLEIFGIGPRFSRYAFTDSG